MVQVVAGGEAVHDCPDPRSVATYCVIGAPPVLVGAAHETTAAWSAAEAVTIVGLSGRPTAVADVATAGPSPTEFLAAIEIE
jgi:hypothetical protein